MCNVLKKMAIFLTVISLTMTPFSAFAEGEYDGMGEVKDAAMAADIGLVRPLGIVSLVAGFGIFIVSSPFSALGGNIGEAWGTLVTTPAKYTFARPLGDF